MTAVTGTMVRDMMLCERRVHLDIHGDGSRRDELSSFVQMLWNGGVAHENRIVEGLQGDVADLRGEPPATRMEATIAAMNGGFDWIVGARLAIGDRLGVPDLLMRSGDAWSAGDAKSGSALTPSGRPTPEYAVQVGHYAAILADLDLGDPHRAFVIDATATVTWYALDAPLSPGRDVQGAVTGLVEDVRGVIAGSRPTRPALSSACALCQWRSVCRIDLEAADDLTLVAGLGRSLREIVEPVAATVTRLAELDISADGKAHLPGLGRSRMLRFRDRARLLATPGSSPFAKVPLGLVRHGRELHLDLETDPLANGFVYLHGILEVTPHGETYHAFFAEGLHDEERAFAAAWAFLHSEPRGHVYHYSRFERTSYRVLAGRYPSVCTAADVEELFSARRSTDLLVDVVQPFTEWPTNSVGIKALAKFLGFSWRDRDASGAASIAWFHEWCETSNLDVRRRILEYNEDDCRATSVLLNALFGLPVLKEAPWPIVEGPRHDP